VPVSLTLWNAGDSYSRSRTNSPTAIRTALSRNGTRQPQDRNASSEVTSWTIRNTTVDRNRPAGTPICGQLPKKPRRPFGACSTDMSTAPPHSPPTPMPWAMRSTTSRIGAQMPMAS
jgi:hypothetical protein